MIGTVSYDNGLLERAQNRASQNNHTSQVLLSLLPLEKLLSPLYEQTLECLTDLKDHFAQFSDRLNVVDNKSKEPVALLELMDVSDNWSTIEVFFFPGAERVERMIKVYFESSKFISRLQGHDGGPYLTTVLKEVPPLHDILNVSLILLFQI